MQKTYTFKWLTQKEEILETHACILHLYPTLSFAEYDLMLSEMLENNYSQLAVYHKDKLIAVSGIWINTKLWCGKYMELDNVIVEPSYQNKGIGKLITAKLNQKAKELNCKLMALDAYTDNKKAHKFYIKDNYEITGFHFTKKVD